MESSQQHLDASPGDACGEDDYDDEKDDDSEHGYGYADGGRESSLSGQRGLRSWHDDPYDDDLDARHEAPAGNPRVNELSRIHVYGERIEAETDDSHSYGTDAATVGTKDAGLLRDVPQSIAVITQQRIRDQNLRTNQDALAQVPSVSNASNPEGFVMIRGFSAMTMIDGVPANNLVGRTQADLAVFDRIEVLEGPSGLLSGTGAPGGTINYVFKKPRREPFLEFTLGGGSQHAMVDGVDASSPLNRQGSIRARAVVLRDARNEFVDVEKHRRLSVYGVVEADLGESTVFSLGYYQQRNASVQSFRQGLPAYVDGGVLWAVPRRTSLTQDWSAWRLRANWVMADVEHWISDYWKVKVSIRQGKSQNPSWYSSLGSSGQGSACGEDYNFAGVLRGSPRSQNLCFHTEYYNDVNRTRDLDAFISGKFELFGREHDLVLGANQERNSLQRAPFAYAPADMDFSNDLFAPNHHVIGRPPLPDDADRELPTASITRIRGLYARATLQISDWVKLPVGGRLTWAESTEGDASAKHEFTPYAGLVMDIDRHWTAYGSYTEIFDASSYSRAWSATRPDGIQLPYQQGKQTEVGLKSAWLDERLYATAAVYELTLNNTVREDRAHPQFALATGQQRTQGLELGLSGKLSRAWNIGAGFAHMDARYVRGDTAQGEQVANTPSNTLNLYTNYEFGHRHLRGLSLGGGLRYASGILGDILDDRSPSDKRVHAPGFTTVSFRVGYRINRDAELSFNIDNVFNKTYWQELGNTTTGNYYAAPRSFMGTLRFAF